MGEPKSPAPRNEPLVMRYKLVELFPPDHPDSPWLLRLMIIRDDLEYELRNVWLADDATVEDSWKSVYHIRRLAVSVHEARGILEFEVGKAAKRECDEAMVRLRESLRETTNLVGATARVLAPIRNALGGHLRPQNAAPGMRGVEKQVLESFPNLEGTITVNLSSVHETSYRQLTNFALALAWPDSTDNRSHETRHGEVSRELRVVVPRVLDAIDALLIRHWWNLGLRVVPDDMDLAVIDPKSGEKRRLAPPRKS